MTPAAGMRVSSLTVAEDAGNATVTVTRTGGSDGAVSVTVTSRDGSATQPADYTAVSTTVSFAAGDTAAKTVNVPIINDTTPETAETLYLTLSAVTGGAALGSTSEALITITDNDVAPPTASRAVISSAGPGKLRIDWTASTGATSYRVMKDATGSAGFTQVGADLPHPRGEHPGVLTALDEPLHLLRTLDRDLGMAHEETEEVLLPGKQTTQHGARLLSATRPKGKLTPLARWSRNHALAGPPPEA